MVPIVEGAVSGAFGIVLKAPRVGIAPCGRDRGRPKRRRVGFVPKDNRQTCKRKRRHEIAK